jgi:hypothetical protein
MEALEAVNQHRAVLLFQNVLTHLHNVVRSDSEEVRVEGGVMQSAEGDAIPHRWDAERVRVWQDVCGLEELIPPQAADRAVALICTHHSLAKLALVQALPKEARHVSPAYICLVGLGGH